MTNEQLIKHTERILKILEDSVLVKNVFNQTGFGNKKLNINFSSGLCTIISEYFDHNGKQDKYSDLLYNYFTKSGRVRHSHSYWFFTATREGFDEAKRVRVEFLKEFIAHLSDES